MPPTKMTNLPDLLARWARLLAFSLMAALAGCGPGTGGTGTGPVQGVVQFSGSGVQGAAPSGSLCQASCEFRLVLEAQRVELSAGCRRFVHVGDWSVDADGKAVLEGQLEIVTAGGTASVPASLLLQFSQKEPTSPQVTALVTGEGGALLAGPAVLDRADAAPATPAPVCRP